MVCRLQSTCTHLTHTHTQTAAGSVSWANHLQIPTTPAAPYSRIPNDNGRLQCPSRPHARCPPAKDPNKASLTQKQRRKVSHAGIDSPATYALSPTSILPAVRRLWTGFAGLPFALSKHKH
ncbi:uncharacterized protein LMH87_008721 [Akanthomyces muscarius]|uniref:Uncharacterized protein n=1 Tax=Akanthomyces muscarius TaxID=2231603 RepID=A0A9W8UPX6_AKAMU|nr:uncharacterized protein LMH87_008721 [Akanthomyces muscarius]KAJ4158183.1 hypothetical protein LMH87_008721 [Akanthomyces muscarius]